MSSWLRRLGRAIRSWYRGLPGGFDEITMPCVRHPFPKTDPQTIVETQPMPAKSSQLRWLPASVRSWRQARGDMLALRWDKAAKRWVSSP